MKKPAVRGTSARRSQLGTSDVFSPAKRSAVMARVQSRGNRSTELALIRVFRKLHIIGWRRKSVLVGKPDFVFPKLKLAIFVDGCFWHSCPIHATQPKNNAEFWAKKLAANKARDRLVNRTLRKLGWRVMRVWEHELSKRAETRLIRRLMRQFQSISNQSVAGNE